MIRIPATVGSPFLHPPALSRVCLCRAPSAGSAPTETSNHPVDAAARSSLAPRHSSQASGRAAWGLGTPRRGTKLHVFPHSLFSRSHPLVSLPLCPSAPRPVPNYVSHPRAAATHYSYRQGCHPLDVLLHLHLHLHLPPHPPTPFLLSSDAKDPAKVGTSIPPRKLAGRSRQLGHIHGPSGANPINHLGLYSSIRSLIPRPTLGLIPTSISVLFPPGLF